MAHIKASVSFKGKIDTVLKWTVSQKMMEKGKNRLVEKCGRQTLIWKLLYSWLVLEG